MIDEDPPASGRRGNGHAARVDWVLLHGNRLTVMGLIVAIAIAAVWVLIASELLAVGPDGYVPTLFGSGVTAGVVALITVALSINQLILSRVFGSPDELADRLTGALDLRRTVERHAGEASSPTDPAAFLAMTAGTLHDRAIQLRATIDRSGLDLPDEVVSRVQAVADYGRTIEDRVEDHDRIVDVLGVILGPEYARHMRAMHHLDVEYSASLSSSAREELAAVADVLESIAIARQFFKTVSLQQDFAVLSRVIIYTGLAALFVSISITLSYRSGSVTVPTASLPAIISLGVGAIVAPLAAFVSYLLRAATIAHRTVSVGPFVPPRSE